MTKVKGKDIQLNLVSPEGERTLTIAIGPDVSEEKEAELIREVLNAILKVTDEGQQRTIQFVIGEGITPENRARIETVVERFGYPIVIA